MLSINQFPKENNQKLSKINHFELKKLINNFIKNKLLNSGLIEKINNFNYEVDDLLSKIKNDNSYSWISPDSELINNNKGNNWNRIEKLFSSFLIDENCFLQQFWNFYFLMTSTSIKEVLIFIGKKENLSIEEHLYYNLLFQEACSEVFHSELISSSLIVTINNFLFCFKNEIIIQLKKEKELLINQKSTGKITNQIDPFYEEFINSIIKNCENYKEIDTGNEINFFSSFYYFFDSNQITLFLLIIKRIQMSNNNNNKKIIYDYQDKLKIIKTVYSIKKTFAIFFSRFDDHRNHANLSFITEIQQNFSTSKQLKDIEKNLQLGIYENFEKQSFYFEPFTFEKFEREQERNRFFLIKASIKYEKVKKENDNLHFGYEEKSKLKADLKNSQLEIEKLKKLVQQKQVEINQINQHKKVDQHDNDKKENTLFFINNRSFSNILKISIFTFALTLLGLLISLIVKKRKKAKKLAEEKTI